TVANEAMPAPSDAAKASFLRGFNMIVSPLYAHHLFNRKTCGPAGRAPPFATSGQKLDPAVIEVVARGQDLRFIVLDEVGDDLAFGRDLGGRALGAFAHGVVDA